MTKKEIKVILDLIKEIDCSIDESLKREYLARDIDEAHDASVEYSCSVAERNILITVLNRLGADTEYKNSIFR